MISFCSFFVLLLLLFFFFFFFFFNDTATTEIYTLSLHDALPISAAGCRLPVQTARLRRAPCGRRASAAGNGTQCRDANPAPPTRCCRPTSCWAAGSCSMVWSRVQVRVATQCMVILPNEVCREIRPDLARARSGGQRNDHRGNARPGDETTSRPPRHRRRGLLRIQPRGRSLPG